MVMQIAEGDLLQYNTIMSASLIDFFFKFDNYIKGLKKDKDG